MDNLKNITEEVKKIFTKTLYNNNVSSKWCEYLLGNTIIHCKECASRNHRIYDVADKPHLPEHPHCKCFLKSLKKVKAGTVTKLGVNGADFYLKYFHKLPNYYLTKQQAKKLGWISSKGNLGDVANGKMIGGDIYWNTKKKLPEKKGRVWYECDIDFKGGYRNDKRIVYSNDGIVFLTENHYGSFIEIV